jgi:hypothetical protein
MSIEHPEEVVCCNLIWRLEQTGNGGLWLRAFTKEGSRQIVLAIEPDGTMNRAIMAHGSGVRLQLKTDEHGRIVDLRPKL